MKQIVVCSECRNVYLCRTAEERCPFCVGAPGEVVMELATMTEPLEPAERPPETPAGEPAKEESPKAKRGRGR